MIITQQIINGVCSVTKTGSYFNLISAGGVVRVRLTKNGSTVLDSKMWVGMNLDKAQPFDEVEIYGEDGPIEFWAGEISMQHFSMSNSAARAIRTKTLWLYGGESVLTNSDLTRTEVRVRPQRDLNLGGAGIGSNGWIAPAGQITAIPLAGTLSAYMEPVKYNLANTQYLETKTDVGLSGARDIYVSDDGSRMISNSSLYLKVNNGAGWENHPDVISGGTWFVGKSTTGDVLAVDIGGTAIRIFRSIDQGETFSNFYSCVDIAEFGIQGASNSVAGNLISVVGDILTLCFMSYVFAINLATKEVDAKRVSWNGANVSQGGWIDDKFQVGVFTHGSSLGNFSLLKTYDGGKTFTVISNGGLYVGEISIGNDGKNIAATTDSYKPIITNDGGETWQIGSVNVLKKINWLFGGLFVSTEDGKLYAHYIDGNNDVITEVIDSQTGVTEDFQNGKMFVTPSGKLYSGYGADNSAMIYQIDASAALEPMKVEVMELLA
ncbi:hypothetical protein [Shewanella algae]|uniref:hypothetical protein n=1 Tax=Shewanella algae TaxID=38313 RepID=UPI0031F5413C